MMKILTQTVTILLVAYASLAFAQQPVTVTVTVTKDVIEADLAGYNLYQDDNAEPFATINSTTSPGVWEGEITLIDGQTSISATAFDTAGNESVKGPSDLFDPPPGMPNVKIEVRIDVDVIFAE